MHVLQLFTPSAAAGELKHNDGRTLDEWIAAGFKVDAYLPGPPGTNDIALVLSKSDKT